MNRKETTIELTYKELTNFTDEIREFERRVLEGEFASIDERIDVLYNIIDSLWDRKRGVK